MIPQHRRTNDEHHVGDERQRSAPIARSVGHFQASIMKVGWKNDIFYFYKWASLTMTVVQCVSEIYLKPQKTKI